MKTFLLILSLAILALIVPLLSAAPVEPDVPKPTFLPALATPTKFEATLTKHWLTLTWKALPGTDEFLVYMKGTNDVTTIAKLSIKAAKELKKSEFDWRIERPSQITIYSVASVVGGLVSKPSQEIRCIP